MISFNDVNEILKKYNSSSFYYLNAIPEKKLRNARAYMNIPSAEKVYGLYDTTFFGSAKEGTCFTEKKIYGRSSSGVDVISYDDLAKAKVVMEGSLVRVNGKFPEYAISVSDLIMEIYNLGAPVNLDGAKTAMSKKDFLKAIELLNAEEKRVKNTPDKGIAEYRKLTIEANISAFNMDTATNLLNAFKRNYASNQAYAEYIADAEKRISDYKKQYEKDVATLNHIFEECKKLQSEKNYDVEIEKLKAVKLRDDFTNKLKKDYYKFLITAFILAEKPDDAEATIQDSFDKDYFDANEKSSFDNQVAELRVALHERFLQEQREVITKRIETAKMYENHGIHESASDTLIAAISDAPFELETERTNLFKLLTDMLLAQYEYDTLFDIGSQYSDISSEDKIGFSLNNKIEQHKSEHLDEYFDHLYNNLLFYMQSAKYERADYYLNVAKEIKTTYELRYSEINLSLLKFDYIESRKLIDSFKSDKTKFKDVTDFDETVQQLENQYTDMLTAISDLLKTFVINNNIEALIEKEGYQDFVDLDEMNLPSIAARFTNHEVLDALTEHGYEYVFNRTKSGFGIALLAAMQLDFEAFKKFIIARVNFNNGECDFVINEGLMYSFTYQDVVNSLCNEKGIGKKEAQNIAIKQLYNECVYFMALLLDESALNKVSNKLSEKKDAQIKRVEKLKSELPDELKQIDAETQVSCNKLLKASMEIEPLICDVQENADNKVNADKLVKKLSGVVSEAIDYANINAEKKKEYKRTFVENEDKFIDTIQAQKDILLAVDKAELISLLNIPSAILQFGEYDGDSILVTLMNQNVKVKMDSHLASLISSQPNKVQTTSAVEFSFNNNLFVVHHNYTLSDDTSSCTVQFTNEHSFDDEWTADKFINSILNISQI